MDNKKNTILLTVIAVATLLVAVVGATFAYFTAQGGASKSVKVTVKTGTAASSNFTVSGDLAIYADQTNFAENKLSKTGDVTGTVEWTAPGSTAEYTPGLDERTFCYTVTLNVTSNNFVYGNDVDGVSPATGTAQLLFNVSRKASGADSFTEITSGITKNEGSLTYVNNVSGIATTPTVKDGTTADYTNFSGFDLTKASGSYAIGGNYTIVAEETKGGAAVTKLTDEWKATVTLVNLNEDQNYNTNKTFDAALVFNKCSTEVK